jgi:5-methyltetrahydropteroyltriglutamate--homocysteine methyltransferase
VDIISDGEIRRESYSNRFATALDGIDLDNPGTALDRTGKPNPVPRVVGPVRRSHPVEVRDVEFLRANTDRQIKITVAGPFTMTQQAQDDYYDDDRALALDYAAGSTTQRRSTPRSRTSSPLARTWCRSTSRGFRRVLRTRGATVSR